MGDSYEELTITFGLVLCFKLRQITPPAMAIQQKLADSTITRVRTHVKSMVGTRLEIDK